MNNHDEGSANGEGRWANCEAVTDTDLTPTGGPATS